LPTRSGSTLTRTWRSTRAAGYTTAVTTIDGIDTRTPRPDPLQLKRIKVSGKDNMLAFAMRMRGGKRGWRK